MFIDLIVYEGKLHLNKPIEGKMCHKLIYGIECKKAFFGGETIKKFINSVDITEHECRDAIQSADINPHAGAHFPAKICKWLATNTIVKTFIIVSSHKVHEDFNAGEYIESIILQGRCRQRYCETIHGNIYWIYYI